MRVPEHGREQPDSLPTVWASMRSGPVVRATLYVAAPSLMFGVFSVLVPLRIHELGGGAGLVAAGFAGGAGLEAIMAPLVGRLSDRVGRLRPFAVGLVLCAVTIAVVPAPQRIGLLLVVVIAVAFGAGLCFAPAMTMLSDAAAATGLHQGFSAGLTNMAWAAGQVSGGAGGGAAAGAAGDALPCLLTALLLLATATAAWRAGESPRAAAGRPVRVQT